jgi:hypothetical protein
MNAELQSPEPTIRDEANALTVLAFRNGFLEELHAGIHHPALDDQKYSRITNEEMKALMVEASERLAKLLHLKETNPEEYARKLEFAWRYCRNWDRTWPVE